MKKISHVLIIETPSGSRFVTLEFDDYSLGRGSQNSLIIKDSEVSRYHATIIREKNLNSKENQFWIYDGNLQGKKSTNGLRLDGERVFKHLLKHKDVIYLGTKVQLLYYQVLFEKLPLLYSLKKRQCFYEKSIDKSETLTYEPTIISLPILSASV